MTHGPDLVALAAAIGRPARDLSRMNVKGLAHDHIAIAGEPILLRVPKQSQFGLAATDNLRYQAACFERVSRSGHAPRLHGVIEPQPHLPMGALLVERIEGQPPALPADLSALAECMARVHALPVPPAHERPPLADHQDPIGGAMAEIEAQCAFLEAAGLGPGARAEVDDELSWAQTFAADARSRAQPVRLVLTDTHPGNFLIDTNGQAIIVDLEKALYGSPGTDLAHATIYSSTTWDPDTWADLSLEDVACFYRSYLEIVDPALAAELRPWLVPLRRITMLRAITWCAKWRVLHKRARLDHTQGDASAEDWSAENTDPATIAHVAGRVDHYLRAATLRRMRGEWLGKPSLSNLL